MGKAQWHDVADVLPDDEAGEWVSPEDVVGPPVITEAQDG